MSETKMAPLPVAERKSRTGSGRPPSSGSFVVAAVKVQELASLSGHQVASAPAEDMLSDELIVERVLSGERQLYEILMRRNNARVFRVIRGITGSDAEAEDVMQDAYVRAYEHLATFEGRSRFSTWLTRIAVYEALARLRRSRSMTGNALDEDRQAETTLMQASVRTPEQGASDHQLARLLETAIDQLPEDFRTVFTLRALDQMSVAEVSECLGILPETVKTRFFRARLRLRRMLMDRFDGAQERAYDFHLSRCNRVVDAVLTRLSIGMAAGS